MAEQLTKQGYINRFIAHDQYLPTPSLLEQFWDENLTQPEHLRFKIDDVHSISRLSSLFSFVFDAEVNESFANIIVLLKLNPAFEIPYLTMSLHILDTDNINNFLFLMYYCNLDIKNDKQLIKARSITHEQIERFINYCKRYSYLIRDLKAFPDIENVVFLIQTKITNYKPKQSLTDMFSGLSMSAPPSGGGGGGGFKKYLKYKAKYLQLKNQLN